MKSSKFSPKTTNNQSTAVAGSNSQSKIAFAQSLFGAPAPVTDKSARALFSDTSGGNAGAGKQPKLSESDTATSRKTVRELTATVESTTTKETKKAPAFNTWSSKSSVKGLTSDAVPSSAKLLSTQKFPSTEKKWQNISGSSSSTVKSAEVAAVSNETSAASNAVNDSKSFAIKHADGAAAVTNTGFKTIKNVNVKSNMPPKFGIVDITIKTKDAFDVVATQSSESSHSTKLVVRSSNLPKRAFTTEDPDLFEKRSSKSDFYGGDDLFDNNAALTRDRGRGSRPDADSRRQLEVKAKRRSRSATDFHFESVSNDLQHQSQKKPPVAHKPSPLRQISVAPKTPESPTVNSPQFLKHTQHSTPISVVPETSDSPTVNSPQLPKSTPHSTLNVLPSNNVNAATQRSKSIVQTRLQQMQQQQTASPPSIVKQKSVTAPQSPGVATATVSKALVAQKSFSDSSTTSATAKSSASIEEPVYSTVIKVPKKPGTPGADSESSRPNNPPTKPVAKGLVAAATKQFEGYSSSAWGRNALSGFYDNNFYSNVTPEDEDKNRLTDEEQSNSSGGDSDFDDFDDDDDDNVGPRGLDDDVSGEPKYKKVAMELLTTERSYVKTLELIDQVYYMEVISSNRKMAMFPDAVCQQMFLNIKSIYMLHSHFLLDKLETVIARWETDGEKIGETMKAFAPFLKMYVEYINNFDAASALITQWTEKSKPFNDLLLEIQQRPESCKLSLQNHMLAPIQRIPRYQLLLQEYIRRLPSTSPDLVHAQKALELVISAITLGNNAQKKIEKFKKLIEIHENLGIDASLMGPMQTLVKEGRIMKISVRSGLPQERYIYLFSEGLLLCQQIPLAPGKLKLKARLDIDGMRILEGHNLEIPDTFIVQSRQLSVELLASSDDEKLEWQEAIANVIEDYIKRMISRQPLNKQFQLDNVVGKMAPQWIRDRDVSMCMKCGITFTFFLRRHHCRGCGLVACDRCTAYRVHLEYLKKVDRVCNTCYGLLTGETVGEQQQQQEDEQMGSISRTDSHCDSHRGVLEVCGAEYCLMNGYMQWSSDCKRWRKLWFAVHQDFALYCFKAHQDVKALNSIPLPSYKVEVLQQRDDNVEGSENIFRIAHTRHAKYFKVEDREQFNRWIAVLEKVVKAELPD